MASVYAATPLLDRPEPEYVKSLLTCRKPGDMFFWDYIPNRAVDVGRNMLVVRFMENDYEPDYLLFIDEDCGFHPDSIYRMVERCEDNDIPVLSAVAFRRKLPPSPVVGKYAGLDQHDFHVYDFRPAMDHILELASFHGITEETENILLLPETQEDLVEVDGVGSHFILIRRDVFEKIPYPWYEVQGYKGGGEDFDFCRKCKKAGIPIHVDYSIFTAHILKGYEDIGIKEFLAYNNHTSFDIHDERWVKP